MRFVPLKLHPFLPHRSTLNICPTVNIKEGTGVHLRMWMKENTAGSCFSCAPMTNNLADVKSIPLTPPKVESATKTGTAQLRLPNILLPNVWKKKQVRLFTLEDVVRETGNYHVLTDGMGFQL